MFVLWWHTSVPYMQVNYVNKQHNYVNIYIQLIYVNLQNNYVDMLHYLS